MARTFTIKGRIETEDASSANVGKVQSAFQRLSSFLSDHFVFTLGDVARAAEKAYAIIFASAKSEQQEQALRISLAKQGESFDKFIEKLKTVSDSTVSTNDLISASSRALLLGIPADQIARLFEIARAAAVASGQSTAEAFQQIAEGVGRTSDRILTGVGFTIDLARAYASLATSLGKPVEQLTEAEQRQAVLNEVLQQGTSIVETYGGAHKDLATALDKGAAAMANFKEAAGNVAAALAVTGATVLAEVAKGFVALAEAIVTARIQWNLWTGDLAEANSLIKAGDDLKRLFEQIENTQRALETLRDMEWAKIFGDGAAAAQSAADAQARLSLSLADTRDRANEASPAVQQLATGYDALATSSAESNAALAQSPILFDQIAQSANNATQQIIFTVRAFDALRSAAGSGAAIQSALAGGGKLINFGTMIQFPDGSVRLVDATISQPSGGQFAATRGNQWWQQPASLITGPGQSYPGH